jgi:hypothetical protein
MKGKNKALIALMYIAITAGALWFTNRSVTWTLLGIFAGGSVPDPDDRG